MNPKLEKLKKIMELMQNDTVTPAQLKGFLEMVLATIKTSKENLESISQKNIKELTEALKYIEQRHKETSSEIKEIKSKTVSEFQGSIKEAKAIIKELKSIKLKDGYTPVKGVDYFDGEKGDKGEDGSPDTGEQIADKLESLEGDARLDASAIKNLEDYIKSSEVVKVISRGGSSLTVKNNGALVGSGTAIDFRGTAISSVTHNGNTAIVTINDNSSTSTLAQVASNSDDDTKATYTLHPSQTVSFKNSSGDSLFEIIDGGNIAQANSLFKVNNGVDGGSAFEADANNYQVKTYTNIVPGSRFTESDGASMMYSIGDLDNSQGNTAPWSYIFQEGAITFTNSDGALWNWQMPTMDELISGSTLALSGTKLVFVPPYDTSTALSATLFADSPLSGAYTYADGSDPDNLGIGATITGNSNGYIGDIDGTTVNIGDTIVRSAESNSAYNGLYIVNHPGDASNPFAITRTTNFDSPATINNAVVVIGSGSGYAGQVFAQTETINDNAVGTDDILFAAPTNNNVTQSASGTQVTNGIPVYTGNAKELTKASTYFKFDPTTRILTVGGRMSMTSYNSSLTETENIFIGKNVGNLTHTGSRNIFNAQSLTGLTSGNNNVAMGYNALQLLTSGTANVAVGSQAGQNTSTTDESVYVGREAGRYRNVTRLVGIGYNAIKGDTTVANNTATALTAIGYRAGNSNRSGSSGTFVGSSAGYQNQSGTGWTIVGANAGTTGTSGDNVSLFGSSSDMTSNYNRIVGLGSSTSLGADDSIALGHGATTTSQYQFVVGSNSSNIKTVIFGNGVTNTAPVEAIITGTSQSGTNKTGVNSIFQAPLGTGNASGGGFVWTTGDAGSSGTTLNTATTKMALTNSGVFRGTALHNNSLAQGSATQQDIRSGTYTPTLTGLTNYSSGSITSAQWMRVGNVVTVSGTGTVTPTSAGFVRFGVSLPITSALTQIYQLGGSGGIAELAGIGSLMIYADATNDRAQIDLYALAGSNDFTFTFTYIVI